MDDIEILIESMKALVKVYDAKHVPLLHDTEHSMFKSYNARIRSYNAVYKEYIAVKNTIRDPRIAVKLTGLERMIVHEQVD